mmetsp:Transcript_49389/g.164891  ORF Transcript_49389/g.164891 Transcript_49389/m.164891 type:complete len:328 (+) Transcript_49389:120-1103(+)|eukprot:CAMPEP_0185304388 /NCGR_PEP_ID=MMETSP1363-20130426/14713_1 /TAXON_ID=38817 /ORGANISM="Gephyrocapsa oceanica, Strain RCC1303" /LENGTH=327 /DNA_ID=CAMNT_0027901583 /DNA_START=104 /DNA_END=1087 /DNA_ORIENTATION=-
MHTALDATSARQHVRCVPSSSVPPLPHRSLEPVVRPGEPIDAEPGCLRGHGTLMRDDGTLVATVSGVVERVNKLVSVRPLRARYHGEVGDVVIGRIVEVGAKRWRADINGRQDAVLMLASINLPGGEQRRRTAEDQLNMRQFYVEHDLLSAEVQAFFQDGASSLHTRSLKYGKLSGGSLVIVSPGLMKRLKQHFHLFEFGVAAIFGMNGYVWVSPDRSGGAAASGAGDELNDVSDEHRATAAPAAPATLEERERVCRVRNALVALDARCVAVSPATVAAVYRASLRASLSPRDMLLPQHIATIVEPALAVHGGGGAAAAAMSEDAGV